MRIFYQHQKITGCTAFLLIFCMIYFWLCPVVVQADGTTTPPPADDRIGAAYLCNIENNLVLYEKNTDAQVYPTSTVKIMTGLLACEALAERVDETITLTAPMLAGASGRNMGLVVGEEMKIYDLLMAAICGSYNDAACVVSNLSAGSVSAMVEQMNYRAQTLGADSTNYTNVTGIHDPAMVTTTADTALVAREAMKNTLYMDMVSTHAYTIPATNASQERLITNRNALVSDTAGQYYNGYCQGMNAGMTDEGGWSVVTVWKKGSATNLCIVMNGQDVAVGETIPAYTYANRLLSWAGSNYTYRTLLAEGHVLDTVSVAMTGTSKSKADIALPADLKVYLPSGVDASTEVSVTWHLYNKHLSAPLAEGQEVGILTVMYNGEVVGTSPLIVTESFSRNGFLQGMEVFKSYLTSRAFVATAICFVILLVAYLRWTTGPGGRYTSRDAYRAPKRTSKRMRVFRKRKF